MHRVGLGQRPHPSTRPFGRKLSATATANDGRGPNEPTECTQFGRLAVCDLDRRTSVITEAQIRAAPMTICNTPASVSCVTPRRLRQCSSSERAQKDHERNPDHPSAHECQRRKLPLGRQQDHDHDHDRDRADCDSDRDRQQVTDSLPHRADPSSDREHAVAPRSTPRRHCGLFRGCRRAGARGVAGGRSSDNVRPHSPCAVAPAARSRNPSRHSL